MRYGWIFFGIVAAVGMIQIFPLPVAAGTAPDIIIREIQIAGASTSDEFIELENTTDRTIDINDWKLRKRTQSGAESSIKDFSLGAGFSLDIPSHGTLLWTNSAGAFQALTDKRFASTASLTDNNSIALFDDKGALIDAITYGTSHAKPFSGSAVATINPTKGQSLTRDKHTLALLVSESPSPENTAMIREKVIAPPSSLPSSDGSKNISIRINELFPNPSGDDAEEEFIELYNEGVEKIDISGFVLKDASSGEGYTFPEGSTLSGGTYFVLPRKESGISLNNADETISLFDRNNSLVDQVRYETSTENASYGYDGSSFRFSRFLTPGAENRFGETPTTGIDLPTKAYKGVPALFSANGSKNRDYFWDFGDGSTSRKQNPSHTYEDTGTFKGFLRVSEDIEESIRAFSIEVRSFPKPDISFSAIAPNPRGTDQGHEWISLKNKGKKKIDLFGFSIATGSSKKKLSNHPIRESFVLKPGKEGTLTSAISSFSLGNKKGFVELRQPDGTVVAKASYAKEDGVADGEVWRKEKNTPWRWSQDEADSPVADLREENGRSAPVQNDADAKAHSLIIVEKEEASETPKTITLEDLSPEDHARLEAQMEEKVRQKIFAQLLETQTPGSPEQPKVLGDSDDKNSPYSGNFFQNLNQAISAFLSKE
mgnify:CR=1 FL=1